MTLVVREMRPADVQIRIAYFHSASTGELHRLGVDLARLPAPTERLEWNALTVGAA